MSAGTRGISAGADEVINAVSVIATKRGGNELGDAQIASFRWNDATGAYDAVDRDGTVYTKPSGTIQ